MSNTKEKLRKEFFARVPKARPGSPVFQAIFELMYAAHLKARPGTRLLNIYASHDFSGSREEVYREQFFSECAYEAVDFWEDRFIREGSEKSAASARHTLPFPDAHFDAVVTTKYIFEHISEPARVARELRRVMRPGGEAFIVVPLVRRQHQKPHDYFRFTEFGIEHLFREAGFRDIEIKHSNGAMVTLTSYAYFFQRGISMPQWLEKSFDFIHYWAIEPIGFFLDRFDNGYGRDLTLYLLVRAKA